MGDISFHGVDVPKSAKSRGSCLTEYGENVLTGVSTGGERKHEEEKKKNVSILKSEGVQHEDFPGGHPS